MSSVPPAPDGDIPQIDKLRLEMITFTYAAAVGYGFSVLDSAQWDFLPDDWLQGVGLFWARYWPGLALYVSVYFFIAIDWLVIRQVYYRDKAYGKFDFVVDMFVVFFFVRMMHSAASFVGKAGVPINFAFWWWLLLVFVAYVAWDCWRVYKAYQSLRGRTGAFLAALGTQRWSFTADCTALVLLALACSFSRRLTQQPWLGILIAGTPCLYLACAMLWWRDVQAPDAAATV